MEQLIFLDTSVIYKLSFIDKCSGLTDEQIATIMLSASGEGNMKKNCKAVKKIIQLYHDIKNGKVKPCVCPTVYCEVLNHNRMQKRDIEKKRAEEESQGREFKEEKTIKDFMNENCSLYIPLPEFKKDFISRVYDLQEKLKGNSVKIGSYYYGLNDEAGYDGKPHSDFDDRVILAEMTAISQYSEDKIRVVNLRTLTEEDEILKYINKIHGNVVNKKKGNYEDFPSAREIIYYHFNQADYGSRVKDEAFTEEAHIEATKLENGIESQLRKSSEKEELEIGVRHIAEYESEK